MGASSSSRIQDPTEELAPMGRSYPSDVCTQIINIQV